MGVISIFVFDGTFKPLKIKKTVSDKPTGLH
jgi:hypothetical protein